MQWASITRQLGDDYYARRADEGHEAEGEAADDW